jgi:hypothetical protein
MILAFPSESEENHEKPPRIAGVLVKISAKEMPNTSPVHYHSTNLLLVMPTFLGYRQVSPSVHVRTF